MKLFISSKCNNQAVFKCNWTIHCCGNTCTTIQSTRLMICSISKFYHMHILFNYHQTSYTVSIVLWVECSLLCKSLFSFEMIFTQVHLCICKTWLYMAVWIGNRFIHIGDEFYFWVYEYHWPCFSINWVVWVSEWVDQSFSFWVTLHCNLGQIQYG